MSTSHTNNGELIVEMRRGQISLRSSIFHSIFFFVKLLPLSLPFPEIFVDLSASGKWSLFDASSLISTVLSVAYGCPQCFRKCCSLEDYAEMPGSACLCALWKHLHWCFPRLWFPLNRNAKSSTTPTRGIHIALACPV